ncbi:MAG: cytochrome c biogenesis protein (TlpA) [Desulfobulbaceae bacterium DB1]|nr:MAG: cytochrome c biogenesis protein (TlpA) [Desulfobulbaceae bacterium DB1]
MKKYLLNKIHFSLTVFLLALLPAFSAAAATAMPSFSLESAADGKNISSEQFKGQVVLVTFFATWCPPCLQEIPSLINLQDEYGKSGFSVVAISVDQDGTKPVKKVIEKTGINYPVLMADTQITRDFGGIVGIPTSFLINRDGKIVKSYPGYVAHTVFVEDIKQIIQ